MTRSTVLMKWLIVVVAVAAPASAQYFGGTIFQSLSSNQPSGVSQIGVPGNSYLTTGEVLVYSQGWTNGAKSLFPAEALGAVLGDRNGDGLPFDWSNIDAMAVTWISATAQPKPSDFRFSVAYDIVNAQNQVLINTGDIFRLPSQGQYQITIPRSAFQAAIGTTAALDVDGYCELSDGSVMVSFKGTGSGNNIVSPFTGGPGQIIQWNGADIFIIRQSQGIFGFLPAIKAWSGSSLATAVNNALPGYGTLTEVRDFDVETGAGSVSNISNDPLQLYMSGTRPNIVFHVDGSPNVLCTLPWGSPATYFWARVDGVGGVGQFATNVSGTTVFMDALCISPNVMPTGSAITLDTSPLNLLGGGYYPVNAPGTSVTFIARNLAGGLNHSAGIALGSITAPGLGYYVGTGGYNFSIIDPYDPILNITLNPPWSTMLTTGQSDANGTAITPPVLIPPNLFPITMYAQAYQLGGSFYLSAPTVFRIQ